MKVIAKVVCTIALGVAAQPALAQSTCSELSSAIDSQLQGAALQYAFNLFSDNGARTVAELSIGNYLQKARADIALMAQNKCPPRKQPLDYMVYSSNALDCAQAIQKGEKNSPACDRRKWHAESGGSTSGGDGG